MYLKRGQNEVFCEVGTKVYQLFSESLEKSPNLSELCPYMGKFGSFLAVFIEILFKIYTRVKLKPKNTIWGTFWGTLGIFASVQRLLHIHLCSLFIGSVVEEVDIRKFACRLIDRFESLYYRPTFFFSARAFQRASICPSSSKFNFTQLSQLRPIISQPI